MYLERLIIENYRSIQHVSIAFSLGKNVLVGKNNAGKSNLVSALNIVLGEKSPSYIPIEETDFHISNDGNRASDFYIVCRISGNDCNYSSMSSSKRKIRILKTEENPFIDQKDDCRVNLDVMFGDEDDGTYVPEWSTSSQICNTIQTNSNTSSDFNVFAFHAYFDSDGSINREYRFLYFTKKDDGKKVWHILPTISNEFRKSFLTSAILPAIRDIQKDLRLTSWGWFGKMLKLIWEKYRQDNETQSDTIKDAIKRLNDAGRPVYEDISRQINDKIRIGFEQTMIRLQFGVNADIDLHRQVLIYVNDGVDAELDKKGSGIQSAVIIGMFSYYCQMHHDNTSLLIVEEPETFLHPQARRAISRRLDDFVHIHASNKSNQVIITTHSPEFVQSGNACTITVIRKHDNATKAKTLNLNTAGINEKEYQKLIRAESAEMFFADLVILCEGAEVYLLPRIADIAFGQIGVLDEYNISIIRSGSKSSFWSYTQLLDTLGIPWAILADFDFLTEGIGKFIDNDNRDMYSQLSEKLKTTTKTIINGKNIAEKTIEEESSKDGAALIESINQFSNSPTEANRDSLIELWKYVENRYTNRTKRPSFTEDETLTNDLDSFLSHLKSHNNIWILSKGELEDYVQISGKGTHKIIASGKKVSDSALARLCQDPDEDITQYFELGEFQSMLKYFLKDMVPTKSLENSPN